MSRDSSELNTAFAGGIVAAVAVGIGMALIGETAIKLIEAEMADTPGKVWIPLGLIGIAALALASVILLRGPIMARLRTTWLPAELTSIQGHPAVASRVLVVTASVGAGVRSALTSVAHHRACCERIYVLHTTDERGCDALGKLMEGVEALGFTAEAIRPVPVNLAAIDDPSLIYQALDRVYDEARADGFDTRDIVLDYTGGTKSFTAAMVLLGAHGDRRLQYVTLPVRDENGQASPGVEGLVIEVDLQFEVSPRG